MAVWGSSIDELKSSYKTKPLNEAPESIEFRDYYQSDAGRIQVSYEYHFDPHAGLIQYTFFVASHNKKENDIVADLVKETREKIMAFPDVQALDVQADYFAGEKMMGGGYTLKRRVVFDGKYRLQDETVRLTLESAKEIFNNDLGYTFRLVCVGPGWNLTKGPTDYRQASEISKIR